MKTIRILDDRPTILMADAANQEGRFLVHPDDRGIKHYDLRGWNSAGDRLCWEVETHSPGTYLVTALIQGADSPVILECGTNQLAATVNTQWDRMEFGEIHLAAGKNTLTMRTPVTGKPMALYSIELVSPEGKVDLDRKAAEMRSSTAWMRAARYGLQFHWTSMSQPRHGAKKPYQAAVGDFDAQRFARMIRDTGAGYVILTTSHAEYFFPGPIQAINRIMPGRTADRDLVKDLIDSLGQFGIRLMLYYHVGHDHFAEPDGWWKRTGFNPEEPEKFLQSWCSIISEIGERYGHGLAGWFFDDGCFYYPLNPRFDVLTGAAKAGNPDRLVCYNPWIWPRFTDFQDYLCGEGYDFLKNDKNLPADGSGIFTAGPHKGLQAHTNFILESDWCHWQPETPIPAPQVPKETFVKDMAAANSRGIVPSVNLEIYQDGLISDLSLEYMQAVKEAVKG
jgi:hypothetical protein